MKFPAKIIFMIFSIALSGCTTSQFHFYAGQGADLATTYCAFESGDRFKEGNPLAEDMAGVLLVKAALIGLVEGMAWLFPEDADTYYSIGAIVGYSHAGLNIYTMRP